MRMKEAEEQISDMEDKIMGNHEAEKKEKELWNTKVDIGYSVSL